jgi:hypothetical protein
LGVTADRLMPRSIAQQQSPTTAKLCSCGSEQRWTTLHGRERVRSSPVNELLGRSALGRSHRTLPRSHGMVLTTKLTHQPGGQWGSGPDGGAPLTGGTTGADRNGQVGEG